MENVEEIGVLFFTDKMDGASLLEYAKRLEDCGVRTLWLPELLGREPFSTAGALLANTETLRIGTGIANVYVRDASSMVAGRRTLAELSDGRFELGLGVSNIGASATRGYKWIPPLQKLRQYFDEMEIASIEMVKPPTPPRLFVAAHGPRLLEFSAQRTDGALTYLMTPKHTTYARKVIGKDKKLHVGQFVLACGDPVLARKIARKAVKYYVSLDYYRREWRDQGFKATDFENDGSDRLIDHLVAWGSVKEIHERLDSHREAGANQIILIPLNATPGIDPDYGLLNEICK